MNFLKNFQSKCCNVVVSIQSAVHVSCMRMLKGLIAFIASIAGKNAVAEDDWYAQINHVTSGVSSTQTGVIRAAQTVGVVFCFVGIIMWRNKTKRGADISAMAVTLTIITGALLVVLPQFITNSSKSIGMDGASVS